MAKKGRDKGSRPSTPSAAGGLADTNCGIVLDNLVATRSWTAVVAAILLLSLFLKAAIGLGGYSGTVSMCTEHPRMQFQRR
jgi:hypothetical protein